MSNILSIPYYGGNANKSLDLEDTGSFKVISTSLETPYDTAKKRQSQIETDTKQLRSHRSDMNLESSINYRVANEAKRKKSDYQVKLVVVGDGGCGKTCLLISYSRGEFPTTYVPTIFENYITNMESSDNKQIELALWDTAGQEEYDRLRPLSYQNVNAILICYSVISMISLNNVKEKWAPEVAHFCPDVPLILVGTKSDLLQDRDFLLNNAQATSFEDGEKVAALIGAKAHIRCSAKSTENINQVFNIAINTGLRGIISRATYERNAPKRALKNKLKLSGKEDNEQYYDEYGHSPKKLRRSHRCVIL